MRKKLIALFLFIALLLIYGLAGSDQMRDQELQQDITAEVMARAGKFVARR